ncbi:MAG TPA: hypothetical protein VFJ02_01005 [Vicinamibacterales bacterium]|nr:hypothetical protein [Vicinamibacterales bacterium]
MRSVFPIGVSAAAACALATVTVLGQPAASRPRDILRSIAAIGDNEWAAVERGEALAKTLETDAREIAVVGAVRINASSDRLVDRYRTIENLKRSAIVIDVGRFGQPPQSADLQSAPFEPYSLDLRDCRPFDCRVRLSEQDITRFQREVDWNAPDWPARSASVWRTVLADHVAAYTRMGRAALPVFVNKRDPLSVASEFAGLVSGLGFVRGYAPELLNYLHELAPPPPEGAEGIVYWTKEDFGVRPVLRVSHQTIYRARELPAIVIATNQIYADHYLDAALTVTLAIDASTAERRAFYLISLSRARTRSLTGFLRSFVRTTVQNRTRDALRKILVSTRTGLEAASP